MLVAIGRKPYSTVQYVQSVTAASAGARGTLSRELARVGTKSLVKTKDELDTERQVEFFEVVKETDRILGVHIIGALLQ